MADFYNKSLKLLHNLHSSHPTLNLGRHLAAVFYEYGDLWGVSDKELHFAIEKYATELEMDIPHSDDVDEIVKEGIDLGNILKEDDDGEEF